MQEEINNIQTEKLLLLTIRAEKYKSKPSLPEVYQILDTEINMPSEHNQSLLRYIPGDPKDSFDIILN